MELLAQQELRDTRWDALVDSFTRRNPTDRFQAARDLAAIANIYRAHEHHWFEFQIANDIAALDRGRMAASKFHPVCRHLCGLGLAGDETGRASVLAGVLDIWETTGIAPAEIPDWIAATNGGMRAIYRAKGLRFPNLIDEETATVAWCAPKYIFDALGTRFDLDPGSPGRAIVSGVPANKIYTSDGLEREWNGFVWLTPPHGKGALPKWIDKFVDHANGIILVPDRTSIEWWEKLTPNADLILFLKRIALNSMDGTHAAHFAAGSALIGIGEKAIAALTRAEQAGVGTLFSPRKKSKPSSTNDNVYTDNALARKIVNYLPIGPNDFCVDGCRARGAFFNAMPEDRRDWCEIREGRDFRYYDFGRPIDWMVTNPPFSEMYAEIAARAFAISQNVAFLVKLNVALGTSARHRAWRQAGHGLREIVFIPWADAKFTTEDGRSKAGEGFCLALLHWARGWKADVRFTYWDE